jgi:prophage regulatory protein
MTMDRPDVAQATSALQAIPTGEELWSLKVVMTKTGLSRSTLYTYIAAGTFPAQRRLGPRRVAWLSSEVDAWIASRPR